MTEIEEITRGQEAERLLANPLLHEALQAIKDGILAALNNSAMGDEKTHNRLAIALQLAGQIEKQLRTHVQTGQMAELQLRDKQRMRDRLKAVVGM